MSIITKYLKSYTKSVRECLEQHPDATRQVCGLNPRYVCIEEYVLAFGQEFRVKPMDKSIRRGKKKECYENIWNLVGKRDDLTYVEGIGFNSRFSLGFIHAWAVDGEGNVIDPTWDYHPQTEYFGIPFDWTFINLTIANRGYFGLLDNHRPQICSGTWAFKRASAFPMPRKHAALRLAVAS